MHLIATEVTSAPNFHFALCTKRTICTKADFALKAHFTFRFDCAIKVHLALNMHITLIVNITIEGHFALKMQLLDYIRFLIGLTCVGTMTGLDNSLWYLISKDSWRSFLVG